MINDAKVQKSFENTKELVKKFATDYTDYTDYNLETNSRRSAMPLATEGTQEFIIILTREFWKLI